MHVPFATPSGTYRGLAILEPVTRPIISEEHMFPYEDSMPCEKFKAITVEALLSVEGYRYQSLAEVAATARNGCKIWGLILQDYHEHGYDDDWFLKDPINLRLQNSTGTPYCQDEVWVTLGEEGNSIGILGLYTDEGTELSVFNSNQGSELTII